MADKDPENNLLGRSRRQRLDAEALRDTMLALAGNLADCYGGPTYKGSPTSDYNYQDNQTVRSVYLPLFRNSLPEIFNVFDYPDPSMVTGHRNTSTVAPQALFMMNNGFVREQARATAQRLLAQGAKDRQAQITLIYRTVLGRVPTSGESAVALRHVGVDRNVAIDPLRFTDLIQALFASPDFRYVN